MESLEGQAKRGRHRPALALLLASSVIAVPGLLLAHSRPVPAQLAARTVPVTSTVHRALVAVAALPAVPSVGAALDPTPPSTAAVPVTSVPVTTTPTVAAAPPVVVIALASTSRTTVTTAPHHVTTTVPPPTTVPRPRVPPARPPSPPPPVQLETGLASWYGGPAGVCAHPYLPLGTVITVTNLATGASATCRVGGRGPYGGAFIVDLDEATFARLAPLSAGVIDVRITW